MIVVPWFGGASLPVAMVVLLDTTRRILAILGYVTRLVFAQRREVRSVTASPLAGVASGNADGDADGVPTCLADVVDGCPPSGVDGPFETFSDPVTRALTASRVGGLTRLGASLRLGRHARGSGLAMLEEPRHLEVRPDDDEADRTGDTRRCAGDPGRTADREVGQAAMQTPEP